jgi:hypothetical protein
MKIKNKKITKWKWKMAMVILSTNIRHQFTIKRIPGPYAVFRDICRELLSPTCRLHHPTENINE